MLRVLTCSLLKEDEEGDGSERGDHGDGHSRAGCFNAGSAVGACSGLFWRVANPTDDPPVYPLLT